MAGGFAKDSAQQGQIGASIKVRTNAVMRFIPLLLMLACSNAAAQTEIYRCTLEDGTVSFQEIPCAEPTDGDDENRDDNSTSSETPLPRSDAFDFVNPFDEPDRLPVEAEAPQPEPVTQDRAECEKIARDAIDAIDLEMRSSAYTQEEGRAYLTELRTLTRQLRACKQL